MNSVGVVQCTAKATFSHIVNFVSPVFFSVNITWRGWEFHLVKSEKVSNIIQKKSKYSFLNKRQSKGERKITILCSQMMFRCSKRRSLINLYLSNAICSNTFSYKFLRLSPEPFQGTMMALLFRQICNIGRHEATFWGWKYARWNH